MRYFLGILIGLGLIVLVFVLILKAFSGGGKPTPKQVDLNSYASTVATAQLVIDAPINSDQEHRTVKISVDSNQTEIDIIQGYQGNVIQTQTFPNNEAAYAVFLHALTLQGFTKGDASSGKQDERGYCPQGNRYIYTLNNAGDDVIHFWSTSCGQGTFGGNAPQVRQLFQRQIPQTVFQKMTNSIPLGG